jgi:soluble lytic murein transglycosylase-like protein
MKLVTMASRRSVRALVVASVLGLGAASDARAEIVFFATGRALSVQAHRLHGETIVLDLRGGGQASFARALILRIEPDEVPVAPPAETPLAAIDTSLDARPFADLISAVAGRHGIDARLVHAIVEVESAYQPNARSPKGAKGLMQLMPATARQYALQNPFDPASNLDAGVRHLKDLLSRLDLSRALAAYNAGEATVRQHGGVPPYPETRSYVRRVLERAGSN